MDMKKYLFIAASALALASCSLKTSSEQKAEMLRMVPIRRLTLQERLVRLLVQQMEKL